MSANEIVGVLLEDDGHSDHMRGWNRVQKWNGAHQTFQHLQGLMRKKAALEREMGQGIAIERALAQHGIDREDVTDWITGDRVGMTSNYKREVPATACRAGAMKCSRSGVPVKNHSQEGCEGCGEPLGTIMRRITPTELRTKFARWIVGVKLNDDRTIWFQEPVPPRDYVPPETEVPAS